MPKWRNGRRVLELPEIFARIEQAWVEGVVSEPAIRAAAAESLAAHIPVPPAAPDEFVFETVEQYVKHLQAHIARLESGAPVYAPAKAAAGRRTTDRRALRELRSRLRLTESQNAAYRQAHVEVGERVRAMEAEVARVERMRETLVGRVNRERKAAKERLGRKRARIEYLLGVLETLDWLQFEHPHAPSERWQRTRPLHDWYYEDDETPIAPTI